MPFHGIDQKACEKEIDPIFKDIRQFYFGDANDSDVDPYIRLTSYVNLVYPIQKEMIIQALAKPGANIKLLRFDFFIMMLNNYLAN